MKLIGLAGRKHSGKDTVCTIIGALVGPERVARVAFADALKIEVFDWLAAGMPGSDLPDVVYYASLDLDGLDPRPPCASELDKLMWVDRNKDQLRKLLQAWGTDYRRKQDENYLIDRCRERIAQKASEGYQVIVVTDCRFPNEADMVKGLGGDLVLVARPGLPNDDTHASETAMVGYDGYDYGIVNDGTIQQLKIKVMGLCNQAGLYLRWDPEEAGKIVKSFNFPECPVDS